MCSICDDLKDKRIDSKEAFRRIGNALQKADLKTARHLMSVSDKILDSEVPITEKDEDLEKKWWDENHED